MSIILMSSIMLLFGIFFMYFVMRFFYLKRVMGVLIILSILLCIVTGLLLNKKEIKLHRIYFISAIVLGIIYSTIIPVNGVPDEWCHYLTSYNVSNSILGIKNNPDDTMNVRVSDYNIHHAKVINKIENYEKYFSRVFESVSAKNKNIKLKPLSTDRLPYIASSIGITIGRILGFNAYYIYFLGRMFNLVLFAFLVSLAIKIIPIAKIGIFGVGLLPMVIHQGMSLSYDSLLFGLSFIIFSLTLYYLKEEKVFSLKNEIFLLVLYGFSGAAILPIKGKAYILVASIPFFMYIRETIKEKHIKNRFTISAEVFLIVSLIIKIVNKLFPTIKNIGNHNSIFGKHIISWCNIEGYSLIELIKSPIFLVRIIVKTFLREGGVFWNDSIGNRLGALNVTMPLFFTNVWILLLFIMFIKRENENDYLSNKTKIMFIGMSVFTIGFILMGMLFIWTPRVYDFIVGVQGRYFLPIVPFIMISLKTDKIIVKQEIDKNLIRFTLILSILIPFFTFLNIEVIK